MRSNVFIVLFERWIGTDAFDFDGEVLELATEAVVGLVRAGGLGQRCLELRLGLEQARREFLLHLFHLLRPHSALTALAFLPPQSRLAVGLLHEPLKIGPACLFLLNLVQQQ